MAPTTDQRILDHMRGGFRPYATVWSLAVDLRLSRPTIRKALNRLAEAGLMEVAPTNVVSEDREWSLSAEGRKGGQ